MQLKLVDDWKESWKFASIQWSAVGMVVMTVADLANQTWIQLPTDIQEKIPHSSTIALVIFGLSIIGRLLMIVPKDQEDGG